MKLSNLLLIFFISISSTLAQTEHLESYDHYMLKSCSEMLDKTSDDPFIQFTSYEIRNDLGDNFCEKVNLEESFAIEELDKENNEKMVGVAEYGKLIDSIYQYYQSIH